MEHGIPWIFFISSVDRNCCPNGDFNLSRAYWPDSPMKNSRGLVPGTGWMILFMQTVDDLAVRPGAL
jgi:hypothetical protein